MNLKKLKKIRIFLSLQFFISCSILFLDISHKLAPWFFETALFLQFIPSFLKFSVLTDIACTGFIIVFILTMLFGRVYCSSVCPLGAMQDIISRVAGIFRKKKKRRYKFRKENIYLRYSLLSITILAYIFGSILLINILDPYSNFGRIFTNLVRPLYITANNLAAEISESMNIYFFYFVDIIETSWESLVLPIVALLTVVIMSAYRGRLFCNTLCPVGTFLGLLSKFSLFRIEFDHKACTSCGACERVCKSECIESRSQTIDFSRCVACYNCFRVCTENGFNYKLSLNKKTTDYPRFTEVNTYRRRILANTAVFTLASLGLKGGGNAKVPVRRNNPVVPPGSGSIEHFTANCTACHLCISACPTFVLQPGFLDYGIEGFLQPKMDYAASFCNYECTVCGEICPSGAILPLKKKDKTLTQIGKVKFIKDNCIIFTDGTDCGACAEHCPTKAVRMEPYGKIFQPVTNEKTCVGCGACEHICPTKPNKAIYIEGNIVHIAAEEPKFEKLDYKVDYKEDFPF